MDTVVPHNMVFRLWSIIWFADSFAPLSRADLPRRGHRLFGNVISFGKLIAVAISFWLRREAVS